MKRIGFRVTVNGEYQIKYALALSVPSWPGGPRILTINCWNEWTEGSYLEPDTVHGMKYLEPVRAVLGSSPAAR